MSVFQKRADLIEHFEFKHGKVLGRVAAAIDILSDAQITIGTHAAYCKQPRNPERPTRDIEEALEHLSHIKELLSDLRQSLTSDRA
jgi:hypothetical protein